MDFKFIAKYSSSFQIPSNPSNYFVKHHNSIYEYKLLRTKDVFRFNRKSLIAYRQNGKVFVLYDYKLEVYQDVSTKKSQANVTSLKLLKKYKSIHPILDNNGIFFLRDKSLSFVVDSFNNTAFCTDKSKLLYFTPEGNIYYTSDQLKEENISEKTSKTITEKLKNTSVYVESEDQSTLTPTDIFSDNNLPEISPPETPCDCYECVHCLPKTNKFFPGFLIEDNLGKMKVYRENSKPLVTIDGKYTVYKDNCEIRDIISISHIDISDSTEKSTEKNINGINGINSTEPEKFTSNNNNINSNNINNNINSTNNNNNTLRFVIVLTTSAVFLIHKQYIVSSPASGFTDIVPHRYIIHNFINECSIYDMFLVFSVFKSRVFNSMSTLYNYNRSTISTNSTNSSVRLDHTNISYFHPERILAKIIVERNSLLKSNHFDSDEYYINFIRNIPMSVKCRAYKLLDEKSKMTLLNFIDIDQLDAADLHCIIAYNMEHYKRYVDRCIEENKLFLLREYYEYLEKGGREEEVREYSLEKGILLGKSEEYSEMYRLQQEEIESQEMYSRIQRK